MKNPNVRILIIAAALIVLVAVVGIVAGQMRSYDSPVTESDLLTPVAPAANESTLAYARVQVNNDVLPFIPLTDGGEYTIAQENGAKNVIRTTRTSVVMYSSTCDNQSCVHQGEVTLDNRGMRVMGNLIVCLPNQIVVELMGADEIPQP